MLYAMAPAPCVAVGSCRVEMAALTVQVWLEMVSLPKSGLVVSSS